MKLLFLAKQGKGKKSNEPTHTLNVLPPNLTVSTLLEIGQNIPPIDTDLVTAAPTLSLSAVVAAQ